MIKRKGSAIIVVIAIMVILVIVCASVMENRTKRAGFTRYMSDEKKAEAFAEAILDSAISKIKKEANDPEKKDERINKMLRTEYPNPHQTGDNTVVESSSCDSDNLGSDYFSDAQALFPAEDGTYEIDGGNIKVELVHVETFGGEYQVVGVDIKASEHKSYINKASKADPNNDNWEFSLMYPATEKSDVSEINDKYKSNKFIDGIYNTYSSTYVQTDELKNKYLDFKYVSLPIDIDLEPKGKVKEIIENPDYNSGVENAFEKTQVDILLKDIDSNKRTAAEFGVYLKEELLENIKTLLKNIQEYASKDGNQILLFIGNLVGNDEAEKNQSQLDKIKEILTGEDLDPKVFNEKLNKKLKEVINDSGASKFVHDNQFDLEDIMIDKLDIFQGSNLKELLPSKMLAALGGSGSLDGYDKAKPEDINTQLVEKGGVLRLTCKIKFTPKGKTSPIKKKLITEIPFKVSDIMPVAPSYTFFVANSSKIGAGEGIGDIDLNGDENNALPDSMFILNNGNRKDSEFQPGKLVAYASNNTDQPPAGKVRINGKVKGPIDSNCGGLLPGKIEYTELPMFCIAENNVSTNPGNANLQLKVTFGFEGDKKGDDDFINSGKIHFPVLQKALSSTKKDTGFTNIVNIFKSIDNVSNITQAPTYLYGCGHLDYPLGITVEGEVETRISELFAHVDPKLKLSVDMDDDGQFEIKPVGTIGEDFVIFYKIKNIEKFPSENNDDKPLAYGLPNINTSKAKLEQYSPTDENMPDFLYSDKQYKKKASKYYKSQAEFDNDCNLKVEDGGLLDGSNIRVDGVLYIDGDSLNLTISNYIGNGLIVAKNIRIKNDISPADDESTLGIIARNGMLDIGEVTVKASCYSNSAPTLSGSTIIGNLITNGFMRSQVKGKTNIVYNSKYLTIPDMKFGKISEYNPRRYFASFANNWSNSHYDNKYDD